MAALAPELRSFDQRIEPIDAKIARTARDELRARRLLEIPGIGPLTATALVATIGHATLLKRAPTGCIHRLGAASVLKLRQNSIGNDQQRGDTYLRTLLVDGG